MYHAMRRREEEAAEELMGQHQRPARAAARPRAGVTRTPPRAVPGVSVAGGGYAGESREGFWSRHLNALEERLGALRRVPLECLRLEVREHQPHQQLLVLLLLQRGLVARQHL